MSTIPFEALLQTVEGAVILAQSVYFQDLIGDAQIIGATKEAATLYGFNHPSELKGKFTSQLDHPDDYQLIKFMAVARMLGIASTPGEYDVRIMLPNGSIRYARKQVKQIEHESNTYWMTISHEISPEEAKPLPDMRDLITADAIQHWFKMISVAELQMLVENYVPLRNQKMFRERLTSSEFQINISEMREGKQETKFSVRKQVLPTATVQEDVLDIGLGSTRRLPDNRFLHRCANCAETWASHVANPGKCPRTRDDNRGAKCGVMRWREITERGMERARVQRG